MGLCLSRRFLRLTIFIIDVHRDSSTHPLFATFWISGAVMQEGTFDFHSALCLHYDLSIGPSPPVGEWPEVVSGSPIYGGYGTRTPNQTMQPTAGRSNASLPFMITRPLQTTLVDSHLPDAPPFGLPVHVAPLPAGLHSRQLWLILFSLGTKL